eukprot:c24709_g1_i3 orf=380-3064(-)
MTVATALSLILDESKETIWRAAFSSPRFSYKQQNECYRPDVPLTLTLNSGCARYGESRILGCSSESLHSKIRSSPRIRGSPNSSGHAVESIGSAPESTSSIQFNRQISSVNKQKSSSSLQLFVDVVDIPNERMGEAQKTFVNKADNKSYSTQAVSCLDQMDVSHFEELAVVDKGRTTDEDVGCDSAMWTESSSVMMGRADDSNSFIPCQGRRATGTGGQEASDGLHGSGSDLSAVSGSGGDSEGGDESKKSTFLELGKHPSSQYKGVVPQPNGRWGAQIYEKHQRVWLGTFYREEDAAKAYDRAALKFRGRDAMTNFRPVSDADPEAAFLNVHTKEQIVDMLRRHTYDEELDQRKIATVRNNRTWSTEAILACQSEVGTLSSGVTESGRNIHDTGGLHSSTPGRSVRSLNREHLFDKAVTPSDVGKLNRLVIPKQHAERCFPLDVNANEKGLILNFEDSSGKVWRFRYSYWNSSQSYVLTKGWSRFVKEKKLDAGDIVTFERGSNQQLFISWRRRSSVQTFDDASLMKPNLVHAPFHATPVHNLCPANYPTLQIASRAFVSVNQILDNKACGANFKEQIMKHQFQQNRTGEKRSATDKPSSNHERSLISSPCLVTCPRQDQNHSTDALNVDFNRKDETASKLYRKLHSSLGNVSIGDRFLEEQSGFSVCVENNVPPVGTGKDINSHIRGIITGDTRLLEINDFLTKNSSSLELESPQNDSRISFGDREHGGTFSLEKLDTSLNLGKKTPVQKFEILGVTNVMESKAEETKCGLRLFGVDLKLSPSTFQAKSSLDLGPQLADHDRTVILQPHVGRECSAKVPVKPSVVSAEQACNFPESIGSDCTFHFSREMSGNKKRKLSQNALETNLFHHAQEWHNSDESYNDNKLQSYNKNG